MLPFWRTSVYYPYRNVLCRGFESRRLHISAFFREKHKEKNVFASVRARDVSGYDSLLLSTTVERGKSPGDPCYEVGESQLADSPT